MSESLLPPSAVAPAKSSDGRSVAGILRPGAPRRWRPVVERWLDAALLFAVVALAVEALWVTGSISFNRWDFSAELEWMEGGSLGHVVRLAQGEPLYTEPSPDWVPFIYHPLYYYVGWAATAVLGMGLPALRVVSLLGFACSLVCLGYLTWRLTRSRIGALVAPAFYAACFELGGGWFDVARVDSFVQGLFLLGLVAAQRRAPAAQFAAAGLFYLCFLGKQSSVSMFGPVVLWALVCRGRSAWLAAAALVVASGLSVAWMQHASNGWYWYYCVELPRTHAWVPSVWKGFWTVDLAAVALTFGALLAGTATTWFSQAGKARAMGRDEWLVLAVVLGGLGTSYVSRLHSGGFLNVLLPALAGLGLGLGVVVGMCRRRAAEVGVRSTTRLALALPLAAAGLQLWVLRFDSEPYRITKEDSAAAARVLEVVSGVPGEVYSPEAPSYPILAGKPPGPHAVAIQDIFRGGNEAPRRAFLRALRQAVAERRYDGILLGGAHSRGSLIPILSSGYRVGRRLLGPYARAGVHVRPNRWLVPLPLPAVAGRQDAPPVPAAP